MRTCSVCQDPSKTRDARFFFADKKSADGWASRCKQCKSTRRLDFEITVEEPVSVRPSLPDRVIASVAVEPSQTKLQIENVRLKAELLQVKTNLREMEKLAMSGDAMRDLVGSLGSPNVTSAPEWLAGASKPKSTHGTAVLFLSDIHFDEVVRAEQIGGSNEYNREIATQSLRNTFRNAVTLLKGFMASPSYDGMVLPLGGDLLSGNIHDELVETNEAPMQQSMLALEEILIESIGGMADEFGKLHIPCVTGNHGRMHKKPRAKNRAFENFEWAVYQRLAAYFKRDSRITFDIAEGSDTYFKLYNLNYCLTHGDQFRGGEGIGGIMSPIMRGLSRKQVRDQAIGSAWDVMMIGHWHQYIHTNRLVINGSVKGFDEYAYQSNFPFEAPQQALFVVHPIHGCTFRMPVLCRKSA